MGAAGGAPPPAEASPGEGKRGAAHLLSPAILLLPVHQMSGTLRKREEDISACSLRACRSPQSLLTPSPSEVFPPGEPQAGTPLTQQDESDEQHDEDGDAEDERKPSLAHAGSSEHGGSWQQGGGRVRRSCCLPRVSASHCPLACAKSSLAPHAPGSSEDPQDVGEEGCAHPTPPRGVPPSCHGHCPPPCPRHPSHPQGNTSL